jgi:hypothetical protein
MCWKIEQLQEKKKKMILQSNENHKETDFWLEKVSSLPTGVRRPLHCGSQWPTSSTHLDSDCLFKQGGMWWVANLLNELKKERTAEGTHAQYVDRPLFDLRKPKLRLLFSITTNDYERPKGFSWF